MTILSTEDLPPDLSHVSWLSRDTVHNRCGLESFNTIVALGLSASGRASGPADVDADMSKSSLVLPSATATPVPSSPPASESFLSDLDGTAPSVLDSVGGDFGFDGTKIDPTALNLVSWKLDVNARAGDGVDKRGFNAISTVLNHPTKKGNPLRASRKPLPPLTQAPPPLPKPTPPAHYDEYLKSIRSFYDSSLGSPDARPVVGRRGTLSDFDQPPPTARPDLPALESVPQLFFDSTFDLSNPSTWQAVVDDMPEAGPSSPPRVEPSLLSAHLDTLEQHLIHEITLRSTSFFSALSNLQDLHSESSSCLRRISDLRKSLREVGSQQARRGLDIIETQERLRVLRITEQGVIGVAELEDLIRVTKGFVEAGDWEGGLGCVNDIVRWWERYSRQETPEAEPPDREAIVTNHVDSTNESEKTPPTPLPLASLSALSSLPTTVSDLTSTIASQIEAALSSYLSSLVAQAKPIPFDLSTFRPRVESMLIGLIRCGRTSGIEDVWRDVMTTAIREGSRKHLPMPQNEDVGEDGQPLESRGASLAESLKGMDHKHFLALSAEINATMLARLRLAQQVGEALGGIIQENISLPALSLSSSESESLPHHKSLTTSSPEFSDVLSSACELAHNRASKILSVRAEQHAGLGITEFAELYKEYYDFILASEQIAKRMIASLRGVTASQARAFLIAYHSKRLTKSAKLVEEEIWTQVDVTSAVQHAVDLLIKSAIEDPRECLIPPPSDSVNGDSTSGGKVLSIEDKSYFVVKATTESLVLLGDYLKVVINLELVVTDVMARIIEFLKSFNSRTCQVVLGAGAMRSAGLKNITAKHLALASQSLSIVISLIPYIREFIRRHLSAKQAVMLTEFDKLKRDYQEHQNEIHAKLVAIMSDRLSVHVGSLRAVDWETKPDRSDANEYAEMLVKETATLHKVLSKYLAAQTVETVMSEVLAAIVHRLSEEYAKIEFKSEDAKKRMTLDVALITTRLTPLAEAGKNVKSLETLVKDKSTPRRPMADTMKGLLRRSASGASMPPTPKKETSEVEAVPEETTEEGDKDEDEESAMLVTEPQVIVPAEDIPELKEITGMETTGTETNSAETNGTEEPVKEDANSAAGVADTGADTPKQETPLEAEDASQAQLVDEPKEIASPSVDATVPSPKIPIPPDSDVSIPPANEAAEPNRISTHASFETSNPVEEDRRSPDQGKILSESESTQSTLIQEKVEREGESVDLHP